MFYAMDGVRLAEVPCFASGHAGTVVIEDVFLKKKKKEPFLGPSQLFGDVLLSRQQDVGVHVLRHGRRVLNMPSAELAVPRVLNKSQSAGNSPFSSRSLGDVLLSQGDSPQLPSALKSLTSVFGMGTGVASSPSSPNCCGFR